MSEYVCIERRSELEELSKALLEESVIGVDTEADSFYHYFDKTCLVQIATPEQIYLVDPLALGGPAELDPLGPVMASPDVRKVFHAAEYDIYVLKRDCGFSFTNLFDTMVSAQLLGYPAIGLSALIERHFSQKLPKDEQRSDWSVRPLQESQLEYAAADVKYLIRLADKLERELRRKRRLEWAQEDFVAVSRRAWPDREFDKLGYLKIKGARRLDSKRLAVLRELYFLRDKRAREVDRPPFKVLGNRTLLEIAELVPEQQDDLRAVKGITDLILRRLGRELMAAVTRGVRRGHGPIPKPENGGGRRRMDRRAERLLDRLKRWRARRASELEMDPGVLCPNSTLEAIVFRDPARLDELAELPEVKGWFAREIGPEVLDVLAQAAAEPE